MKFLWLYFFLLPVHLMAQTHGKLVDAESNEPIYNAQIIVNGYLTIYTDHYGLFSLDSISESTGLRIDQPGYFKFEGFIGRNGKEILIKLVPNPHQLSEVVVSSSTSAEKLKRIAGNYSILGNNELQRSSAITVAGYLNLVPGVFMQQGALNTNRMTIRGVGSRTPYNTNRIKAYFDEIPLTGGDGSTTMEDIDIGGISRIEILKGPSSALYGAGLGGVVKIYPSSGDHNSLSFNSEAGSFGTFKNMITSSLKMNHYNVTAVASKVYSDGYRENSRYKRNSAFIFGSGYGKKSNLKATLSLIDVNSRIPSSLDEKTFEQSPQSAASNWLKIKGYEDYVRLLGGLTYSTLFSKQLLNQATVFAGSLDHYQSRPFNILWENFIDYGLRDKLTLSYDKHTFVAGFEWFNEDYKWKIYQTNSGIKGPLTANNKENRNYTNVFFLWAFNLQNKWVAEAGINVNTLGYAITDLFADNSNNSGHDRFKPIISPRIGLNYQATKSINLYTSVGHGFSAPSLQETLLPAGQPNPDIKPEQGYNIDVGTRLSLLDNRLYIELCQYWMFLRDLLVTKRITEEIFTGENAGTTNHRGIEVTAKYSFFKESVNNSADVSITYTNSSNRFKSFADTSGDYSGKHLPGIPSEAFNLNFSTKIQRYFYFFADIQRIGGQYMTDDNSRKYGGYKLVGVKIAYETQTLKKYGFTVYTGVQNLFNEQYASMILVNALPTGNVPPRFYYPGNPRSFYAGLKISFSK